MSPALSALLPSANPGTTSLPVLRGDWGASLSARYSTGALRELSYPSPEEDLTLFFGHALFSPAATKHLRLKPLNKPGEEGVKV